MVVVEPQIKTKSNNISKIHTIINSHSTSVPDVSACYHLPCFCDTGRIDSWLRSSPTGTALKSDRIVFTYYFAKLLEA